MPKTKTDKTESTELVVAENGNGHAITLPSVEQGAEYVAHYKQVEKMLDAELGDCIIEVQTRQGVKPFRVKRYWRAVGNCFKLSYAIIRDERIEVDGDWGYEVTVRATDLEGRFSDGDGSCYASEKIGKNSKVHDVRAHAKTRATNRAIADLVAFGEVTYDELTASEKNSDPAREQSDEDIKQVVEKTFGAKVKAVNPEPQTLDDHDGEEYIESVKSMYALSNGTTVYHIQTNRRKYTCLKEDVVTTCQQAEANKNPVTLDWEAMTGKPKDGKPGRKFNALKDIQLQISI